MKMTPEQKQLYQKTNETLWYNQDHIGKDFTNEIVKGSKKQLIKRQIDSSTQYELKLLSMLTLTGNE